MSHFAVLVVGPENDKQLAKMMAPFDENKKVRSYDETCHCVGHLAKVDARVAEEREFGAIDAAREAFHKRPDVIDLGKDLTKMNGDWAAVSKSGDKAKLKSLRKDFAAAEDKQDKLWAEFARIDEREAFVKRFVDVHPLNGKADPNCSECKGTGTVRSTYNPKSKWDWYGVGGRFHGDIRNHELDPGFAFDIHESVAPGAENTVTAKELKERVKNDPDWHTYALLDKAGWHTSGDMGWWGISSNDKDNWPGEFKSLVAKIPDETLVTLVDCHI